jgi:hypothetical protein
VNELGAEFMVSSAAQLLGATFSDVGASAARHSSKRPNIVGRSLANSDSYLHLLSGLIRVPCLSLRDQAGHRSSCRVIDRTLHEIRCFAIKARRDCAAISSQDAVSHADTVEGHSNEVSSCMIWFFVLLVFTMTECIPACGFLASANSIPLHRGGNSKCRTEKSLSSPEHRLA